ncbi:hypothetical protein [Nitrosomonas sp. HPC101]|uniref:hypothetical protein n=1 Tax=Nitrosomonas sp. HPC101 TaxID=1658667 RepID=UPI001F0400F8|nr:hypothetical protein [Nitrosomonas sp. HPC101]
MIETSIKKGLVVLAIWALGSLTCTASGVELVPEGRYLPQAEIASVEELDSATGREGIDVTTLNNMNVRALLSGNTATNNTSGVNMIDNGSFAGSGGMFSVIQNSGNNVLIQDSTIINVTVLP